MKAIYIDLPCITLKDKSGKTFDLWLNSYNETSDEIYLRTSFRESEVKRGWIGDLSYQTAEGCDMYGEQIDGSEVLDTYVDVLLASISVYEATPGEPIIFEYRFLKK